MDSTIGDAGLPMLDQLEDVSPGVSSPAAPWEEQQKRTSKTHAAVAGAKAFDNTLARDWQYGDTSPMTMPSHSPDYGLLEPEEVISSSTTTDEELVSASKT